MTRNGPNQRVKGGRAGALVPVDRVFPDGRLPVSARHILVARPVAPHAYPCVTLTFVSSGQVRKLLPNGKWLMLRAGQLSISDAGMLRAFEPEEPASLTLIHIGELMSLDDAAWLEQVPALGRLVRQHRTGASEPIVVNLGVRGVAQLMPKVNALMAEDRGSPIAQLARLLELLEQLVDLAAEASDSPPAAAPAFERLLPAHFLPSPAYQRQVREAMLLMIGDLRAGWTMDGLAARVHLSSSSLSRAFSAQVGLAPMQYLAEIRMRMFAHLLRNSDLSVTLAARSCGFADPSYGARRFRQRWGQAPSDYRTDFPQAR